MKLKPITLDEIPASNPWPARLLGVDAFQARTKNTAEILREFDTEKWGPLLKKVKDQHIDDVMLIEQELSVEMGNFPCVMEGSFFMTDYMTMNELHLLFYEEMLGPLVDNSTALVELGAGYGAKILQLAQRGHLHAGVYIGGELSGNGCEAISLLAASQGLNVRSGVFDFLDMEIADIQIPENAVIFTSYAMHYMPHIDENLIRKLADFHPKAVIHFEPCYEFHELDSLYGLMCRKYIELNDYNRNLAGLLESMDKDEIEYQCLAKNRIGSNPFLPISALQWQRQN